MKHLLVIEDDQVDQMAFERFTKTNDFPFTYQLVDSVKAAKEALQNNTYDAVVSDYFLGDGTTFEILDLKIDIPIVVVTGTGSEEIAVDALKKGAFDYLIKDIDGYYLRTLVITVQNAIHRFNTEKELKKYHQKLEELVEERTMELKKEIEVRKKTEINLKKLSTAVEQSPALITITDLNGNIEYVNPKFIETSGYTFEEIKGKKTNFLKSGEHTPEFYQNLWNTILAGNVFRCEICNKKKDGTLFWESAIISSIKNDKGNIRNFLQVAEDITQKKQITSALQKSEENLQKAQQIAKIGSFNLDLKTNLAVCSPTFFNITELEKVSQQAFFEWRKLIHPDDFFKNTEILKKSFELGFNYNHEFRIISNVTKTLKWIHAIGEVNLEQQIFEGVLQDITERKQAEQVQKALYQISTAVSQSENLGELTTIIRKELGTFLDTTNFYIALFNEETNSISLPFFTDEKDKFKEIPAGNTLTDYIIKTKKSLLASKKQLTILGENNKIKLTGTIPEVWLGVPLMIENKTTGVIAVQSYTHKDAFSEKDKELLEFVSNQIGISIHRKKREVDLKNALEKATESDRLKTAFLQNMSHEIRTPMNGILGFSDLLKNPELNEVKQQKYIAIIAKSSKRLLSTLNNLMDVSKLETGQIHINYETININEELSSLFEFYKPEAESKGIHLRLSLEIHEEALVIQNDRSKFEAVVTNLLKNAIKYSQQGTINLGYTLKNNEIEFFVSDTGIGIPKDRQNAIFQRFVQADIEDKQVFEGVGLGLSISKSYIEMMQGKIWVESEEDKGSTFYFTLPLINKNIEKPTTKLIESIEIELNQPKKINILIAEDDDFAYEYLTIVLEGLFNSLYRATTGVQAIEICENHPDLDLILMDVKMPVVDGYEATRTIRKFNKSIVIIAQTAYALMGDKEVALEAGCNEYISKPINSAKLKKIVSTYFKQ